MARSKRARAVGRRLTAPVRAAPLPILQGKGRGLRVRLGASPLARTVRTGERGVEDALLGLIGPGDVVYDVGANIGWYTLLAARRVGPSGRVLAFEPNLANATFVERNAATNGFTNVTVVPAAVSDRDGWATFLNKGSLEGRLDKDDDDAQAKRRAALEQRVSATLPVPVLSLDAWITAAGQPPPDVVKLDIEGGEIGALRGMGETVRACRPRLMVELHGTRDAVVELLESFDYEHEPVERDGPTSEAPGWVHVLARPRG